VNVVDADIQPSFPKAGIQWLALLAVIPAKAGTHFASRRQWAEIKINLNSGFRLDGM